MTVPTGQPFPNFCGACGLQLTDRAPRCPRCGADVLAVSPRKRGGMGAVAIVAIVIGAGVVGLSCLGILAAIAIPNFIRYQLRSKFSEVRVEVASLVMTERATLERTGKYVALATTPSGQPGPEKATLTPGERQQAAAIDWIVGPSLYGRYTVAVSADGRAAAVCGVSDIDGDGTPAEVVAFLPDDDGNAPDAPCTAPVAYDGQAPGDVEPVTGPNVF
jgi:type IV pilus assembly protein PilA